MKINPDIQVLLQEHFLTMQRMLKAGFPRRGVQKSFEELVYSVMGKNSWRPTHISKCAVIEYVDGCKRNIQRAHGVLPDRMDRIDRTMSILSMGEVPFEDWWTDFTRHDKTVLITRKEHGSGKSYNREDLIQLPDWGADMFYNSGFSVKIRKKTEGVWLENKYKSIMSVKH